MDTERINEIARIMCENDLRRVIIKEADGTSVELERAEVSAEQAEASSSLGYLAPMQGVDQHHTGSDLSRAGNVLPNDLNATRVSDALSDSLNTPHAGEVLPDSLNMSHATVVSAPMVGVFYAASSPGAEPFVRVGDHVHVGQTLCIVEAMKVMNEVRSEVEGEIVDICVEDGDLVEYGSCLMKIC